MRAVRRYLDRIDALPHPAGETQLTPLGRAVSAHLGVDASTLPVVVEEFPDHRAVDAELAFDALAAEQPDHLVGIGGGEPRWHQGFAELVSSSFPFRTGPVDYVERATGPDTSRRVVALGLRLIHIDGAPVAIVQRVAAPRYGREFAQLEVMAADSATVSTLLARLRALMIEHSVLRGQLLSFQPTQFGQSAGATFLPRPSVVAEDIVLADGVLATVTRHVVGIGRHRDALRAEGQHLKRGVLLYGPPGTGKTLMVRHLIAQSPEVTVILLTGQSIRFIQAAAEIARTFQPSMVVLEDIDLVAMERMTSPQPLLFEVLEALDGLDGDADVTFLMTTNRVEVLERALVERPGRVDLAVDVPRPAETERARLLVRYSGGVGFSAEALAEAARRTEGVTASFFKELVRRVVLRAAERGEAASDADLAAALDELLDASQLLTRRMLGGEADAAGADGGFGGGSGGGFGDGDDPGGFGYFSYSPGW